VEHGGRRSSSAAVLVAGRGGRLGRCGVHRVRERQWDVFFNASPHGARQGAEQQELAGRRGLFAGILTAIRVRRQARVLVRLVLSGLPSAPVPHVRVRSCVARRHYQKADTGVRIRVRWVIGRRKSGLRFDERKRRVCRRQNGTAYKTASEQVFRACFQQRRRRMRSGKGSVREDERRPTSEQQGDTRRL